MDIKGQVRINQKNAQGKSNIKIRISHKGQTRYIKTSFYVLPERFDNKAGKVKKSHDNAQYINIEINNLVNKYEQKGIELGARVNSLSMPDLLEYLKGSSRKGLLFFPYAAKFVKALNEAGRSGYADIVERSAKQLAEFAANKKLTFQQIDAKYLRLFETWYMKKKAVTKKNSYWIKARDIRTIFNHAINSEQLGPEVYPFRKYKIGREETRKRALSIAEIKAIIKAEPGREDLVRFRDLWLLQFYLIGINPKDLILALPDQVQGGRLYYDRAKTHKNYSIKIHPEAMALINKYKGAEYLLDFVERVESTQKQRKTPIYKDVADTCNEKIKAVCKMDEVKILEPVSNYWARHSWATIAANMGVSEYIIKKALGHGSRTVTEIYIDFDLKQVDQVNSRIIKKLIQK